MGQAEGESAGSAAPAGGAKRLGQVARAHNGQRRRRVEGGRPHQVLVRMTDEEYVAVAAKAKATALSIPALVAAAALSYRVAGGEGAGGRLDPAAARAVLVELHAVRRGLGNAGRNINDVARFVLGTGELKESAQAAVRDLRAATARLEAFLEQAAALLPGVDLSQAR